MSPILFALIAFIGWGTGDIFGGLVARKIGGYSSALLAYLIFLVVTSFYIPFALSELTHITPETIVWLLLLTPIGIFPLITLYEGIKVGNASLVGTISGSFGGLVSILSVIFLGESISLLQAISIITIFLGVILSSFDFKTVSVKHLLSDKGIPYALISLVLWGLYFTFVKIPIKNIGWFWPAYFSWWGFPLVLMYMKAKSIKLNLPSDKKHLALLVTSALISIVALFSYNFASATGKTSIVTPIASSYPALFALLAYFVFRDRLSKQQIIGIVITLSGVLSLSLLS